MFTPGVRLLTRASLYLSLLVVGVTYANGFVSRQTGYVVPLTVLLPAIVLLIPIAAAVHYHYGRFKIKRKASALGARLIPEVPAKLPGKIDVLRQMIHNFKHGYPGDGLFEVMDTLGQTVNINTLWTDIIVTNCPDHIKAILATDFQNFVKGERFSYNMGQVLGTGVFNSDGDMWKFHRSITRPMFTRERISHFELFDHHASLALTKLKERLRDGHAVDFQDLMSRFTLDTATSFLFGASVDSLSAGLPYPPNMHQSGYDSPRPKPVQTHTAQGDAANDFARAFLEAQEVISVRERFGWVWPLVELWEDKARKPMEIVDGYIEPIVKAALEKKRREMGIEKTKEEEADGTLLDHLVGVTDDPKVLKDEILNIMIAGRDTTASTLTFIVYFLCTYPNVLSRLRQEVLDKVGPSKQPTYDDIRDMKYLRSVINETLRLYPIVPFNVRENINDTILSSENPTEKPFFLPAGTRISYSVFMMHRRKDLWGPDAEEFDPDRFLDSRLKTYLSKNPFIFLPFNAGPRICLGQQFAYNEMSFLLIRLLQSFDDFELDLASAPEEARVPEEWQKGGRGRKKIEKVMPKTHLTLYVNGGLWIKMKEGNKEAGA